MSDDKFNPPKGTSIIKHKGDPNTAITLDGYKVTRQETIFIPEMMEMMKCAPYDNHFIYEDPSHKPGRWAFMCTCGGPAVYVGASAYRSQGSPTKSGHLLVCYYHLATGKHTDGSS